MFFNKQIEKSNYAISDGFVYEESEFQQTNRTGLAFCGISVAKDVRFLLVRSPRFFCLQTFPVGKVRPLAVSIYHHLQVSQ